MIAGNLSGIIVASAIMEEQPSDPPRPSPPPTTPGPSGWGGPCARLQEPQKKTPGWQEQSDAAHRQPGRAQSAAAGAFLRAAASAHDVARDMPRLDALAAAGHALPATAKTKVVAFPIRCGINDHPALVTGVRNLRNRQARIVDIECLVLSSP